MGVARVALLLLLLRLGSAAGAHASGDSKRHLKKGASKPAHFNNNTHYHKYRGDRAPSSFARGRPREPCKRWDAEIGGLSSFATMLERGWLPAPKHGQGDDDDARLAVLIPWSGTASVKQLPWLRYWFASVRANAGKGIDWLVFAEPGEAGVFAELKAPNLRVIETDLAAQYSKAMRVRVPMSGDNLKCASRGWSKCVLRAFA